MCVNVAHVVCVGQHGEDDQWYVHGGDCETGPGEIDDGRSSLPLS